MLIKIFHAIKRSAFLRLLLIFLLSTVLILILVAATAHYINDPHLTIKHKFQDNIVSYTRYLIEKIGSPPDYDIAQKLSEKNSLHIKIVGGQKKWKSQNYDLPRLLQSEQKKLINYNDISIGHNFTYSYIVINKNNYKYIIAFSHRRFSDREGLFIILLIFIIIGVTSLNYYLVRLLFKPLRLLDEGVKQVGEGNFDFRIITKRQDEMGELAMAFNKMSDQIQSMMKEKEQLLMDVSHELRSPITRMKLALEFVINNKSKESIQEDLIEMDSMITELLESARLNSPNATLEKQSVEFNSFLNSITKIYIDSDPGLQFQPSKLDLLANIDRNRIQICIRNIIDNALKYSRKQNRPVVMEVYERPNDITIAITDFGIGIPKQDQKHIFEPFYRVDKSRNSETGGYGLGLNLCKNIMQAHGGTIIVESSENIHTSIS
ncbi:MAG: sensor histidine kinase, partial [Gammaproteobacteria bacterium]